MERKKGGGIILFAGFIARANGAGWTDGEIADVLDVRPLAVLTVRRRLGLAAVPMTSERVVKGAQRRFEASMTRFNRKGEER